MKSADKNILLLASLINLMGLKHGDLASSIPNYDKEVFISRLKEVEYSIFSNKDSKQVVSNLLNEFYKNGVKKKGWLK